MEDPKAIIKELIVDWDTVLTNDFNPLHISLAINNGSIPSSDFRDMYHKLESAMEKIISINFKGFSDSVMSYNLFNKNNKILLEHLQNAFEICGRNLDFDFQIKKITEENEKVEYFKSKYDICKNLVEIKVNFDEFLATKDILKRCNQIVKCLDNIDQQDFFKIKGVCEYRKLIVEEYQKLAEEVNMNVFRFIFHNEINNSFKCVLSLGGLYELESFIRVNFQSYLFNTIENIIISMYKDNMDLDSLCWSIMSMINMVIRNVETIIELTFKTFKIEKDQRDFFGNKDETYKFVTKIDSVLDIIKEELVRFVERYSMTADVDNNFGIDNIIDNLDYNKIYELEFNIFTHIDQSRKVISAKGRVVFNSANTYTLITTPKTEVASLLLNYSECIELKKFLNLRVETEYTKFKLEKNKKKIDYIFEDEITCNPTSKRLNILSDLVKIVKIRSGQTNCEGSIIDYLNGKVIKKFDKLYDEIFKSKLVKLPKLRYLDSKNYDIPFEDPLGVEFRDSLVKSYITKDDLLLTNQHARRALYATMTIKDLDSIICTTETAKLYDLYFNTLKRQLNLAFIYYFDLFYRDGHFSSGFYLKKMVRILQFVYEEFGNTLIFDGLYETIEYYTINNVSVFNVKSAEDIKQFVSQIKILDEIVAEVEFYNSLQKLYDFFDKVLSFQSKDPMGLLLEGKIRHDH